MNNNEIESVAIKAAAEAKNKSERPIRTTLKLSNGVVLKIKPSPPLLMNYVSQSIPEPEVPTYYDEDDDKHVPNPSHPDYVRAMAARSTALNLATINLILCSSTELESVPDDVPALESDDWLILAKMAGIEFNPNDKTERYLTWLRACAITTTEDLVNVQSVPLTLAGLTEGEVDEVLDSFRGGEERGADTELPAANGSTNGNNLPNRRGRPRTRDRGA